MLFPLECVCTLKRQPLSIPRSYGGASKKNVFSNAVMTMKRSSLVTSAKKSVFLVDDHPMMRHGLAMVINQQRDITVSGEAGNAREAMERIALAKPDIAVVDISLEGKSGLEMIKDLQIMYPEIPVLVMSMHDEALYAERVLRAGGRGYVMKKAGGEAMLQAIRQVLSGHIYLSEKMSARILELFTGPRSAKNRSPIETLTDREFEVFQLIGHGRTTRDIGEQLHISAKTVDVYRQHIKEKLNISSAIALIQHAVRWVEAQGRS